MGFLASTLQEEMQWILAAETLTTRIPGQMQRNNQLNNNNRASNLNNKPQAFSLQTFSNPSRQQVINPQCKHHTFHPHNSNQISSHHKAKKVLKQLSKHQTYRMDFS